MRLFKLTICLFLSLSLIGCVSAINPATGKKEFIFIGTKTEVNLGRTIARQVALEKEIIKSGKEKVRIENMGRRIARYSDRQDIEYQFFLIKDKELNAFALPGGFIYIHSALSDSATDDELACVIAHEIAHVAARHSVKQLQASLGYQLVISAALGGKNQVEARQISNMVFSLSRLGYSRTDEMLADKLGLKYAYLADYNPAGMISFFKKLKQEAARRGGSLPIEIFSSHPDLDKRIQTAKQEIKRLQSPGE